GRHYDGEPKSPDRKDYIQEFSVKKCLARVRISAAGRDYRASRERPPLPGEFNLARRERPAAEPAAMGIRHHGVDLP
ncbi:MAG: hypothetical protein PHP59_12395, partial [Methanofollis sp.]|uniref:hypothetical protein n=1 Tax=Methanofollis sp. TaxID=2052835 RepID=UPI00260F0E19